MSRRDEDLVRAEEWVRALVRFEVLTLEGQGRIAEYRARDVEDMLSALLDELAEQAEELRRLEHMWQG